MLTVAIMTGALLTAADACAPPSSRDRSPCSDRVGHCFELAIDGTNVVPMADMELRRSLDGVTPRPVCWRLPEPVSGPLEPAIGTNAFTDHLGPLYDEVEIVVTALAGQEIPTRKGVRTDPTVRIGGVAMQTVVDVVDVATLPDGPYVATFRARGPEGWDRKAVYLEVERGDAAAQAPAESGDEARVDAAAPYDPDNIFARIIRGEAPAEVVYANEHAMAFRDIRPQAPVHVLVVPRGPYANLLTFNEQASAEEKLGLLNAIAETARITGVDASGFKLVTNTGHDGGQTVPHLHFHLMGGADLATED